FATGDTDLSDCTDRFRAPVFDQCHQCASVVRFLVDNRRASPSNPIDNLWREPMVRFASKNELLPGTLEMLILQTLTRGAMHGYGIAQRIQEISDDVLQVEEGSL